MVFQRICLRFNINCDKENAKNTLKAIIYREKDCGQADKIWSFVQAGVYSFSFKGACLYKGFEEVYASPDYEIVLVSHKTEKPYSLKRKGINLRNYCLEFLKKYLEGFQNKNKNLIFFSSKEEKIEHLRDESYDLIIDDLEEIVQDPSLKGKQRICFGRHRKTSEKGLIFLDSWEGIEKILNINKKEVKFTPYLETEFKHCGFVLNEREHKKFVKTFERENLDRWKRELHNYKFLSKNSSLKIAPLNTFWERGIVLNFIEARSEKSWNEGDYNEFKECLSFMREIPLLNMVTSTDALLRHRDILLCLEERLKKLKSSLCPDYDSLSLEYKALKNLYISGVQKMNLGLEDSIEELCFCFSDFSSDNLILSEEGLYWLDLESSGLDDPLKMLLNIYFHPKSFFLEKERMKKAFCDVFGPGVIDRYSLLAPLWKFNWKLIQEQGKMLAS